LRGVLPWFQLHIPAIIDARDRLLAPGGVLIPRKDFLWAAVVEATDEYERIVGPWQDNSFDLDLSAGVSRVTNTWRKTRIRAEELLTESVCWATLDYQNVRSHDVVGEITWRTARGGTAHGIAVWFDTDLADGVGFSNRPGTAELIYGTGFFPFPQPVPTKEAETVSLKLRADLVQDNYVWRWDTDFAEQKIAFRQSTFYGVALSPEQLRKNYA
jgi:protein arginine N-methyltransferase 1